MPVSIGGIYKAEDAMKQVDQAELEFRQGANLPLDTTNRMRNVMTRLKTTVDGIVRIQDDIDRLDTDYGNLLQQMRNDIDKAIAYREGKE